jgi:two-component system response regulator MprA
MDGLSDRVLVVDDEDAIRDLLEYGLSEAGFAVRSVPDGHRALEAISDWTPAVILLDVMLPHLDGYALLPMMRKFTDAPIIMLSAKGSPPEKVAGLVRGADDYVAKPFDMEELVARINTALRRPRLEVRETLRYADITVDIGRRTVVRGKRTIDLSPREFELLSTLMRNSGRVITRAHMLDLVWGIDKDVTSSTVDTYISYLRTKLETGFDRKLIHTVRGVGYMLRDGKR